MAENYSVIDILGLLPVDLSKFHGNSTYIDCPVCGGRRKFNINVAVGGGVCRCARCNVGGGKLDMFVLLGGDRQYTLETVTSASGGLYQSPSNEDKLWAAKEIERLLGIHRQDSGFMSRSAKAQKALIQNASKPTQSRTASERSAVYTALLEHLSLQKAHQKDLVQRGLLESEITALGYKSTPNFGRERIAKALLEQGYQLDGIPGFFKTKAGEWSLYTPNAGYFIPMRDVDGNIFSLQIRHNQETPFLGKYGYFSSSRETLDSGNMADGSIHVEMPAETPRYLYVTEGPLKSQIAHMLYRRLTGKDDILFLAPVGCNSLSGLSNLLSKLECYSFDVAVEFLDKDKFHTDAVINARNNVEILLKQAIIQWNRNREHKTHFYSFPEERYMAKGIDDHLLFLLKQKEKQKGVILNENQSIQTH